MAKFALLIGVSDYGNGFNPLPKAVKDVEVMAEVLQNPEMGAFDVANVTTLANPDAQTMRGEIETFFYKRHKNDLVLLYFSGHGIKDDRGNFYFSTRITRKNEHNELVRSTAIEANFVHDTMKMCRSRQQVVILDCCFSAAFADGLSTAKGDDEIDVNAQLGGKGRAILTSSTSTQLSFEQEQTEFSVYTHYLVEGIKTGEADEDGDNSISVEELHEYAKRKVQEAVPQMQPKYYPSEEGGKIVLAKTPVSEPEEKYRQAVRWHMNKGELTDISREILNEKCKKLRLSRDRAYEINEQVAQSYREHQQRLKNYEKALRDAAEQEFPLRPQDIKILKDCEETWKLTQDEIRPLHLAVEQEFATYPEQTGVPESLSAGKSPATGSLQTPYWFIGVSIIVALIGIGSYAYWRQVTVTQNKIQALWQQAEEFHEKGMYEQCVEAARQVPENSKFYVQASEHQEECQFALEDRERLDEANTLSEQGKHKEAIQLAAQISRSSLFYDESKKKIEEYSDRLFRLAEEYYKKNGELMNATASVNAIPENSFVGKKAREKLQQWQTQDGEDKTHLNASKSYLDDGNPWEAKKSAEQISDVPYLQDDKVEIISRAENRINEREAQAREAERKKREEQESRQVSIDSSSDSCLVVTGSSTVSIRSQGDDKYIGKVIDTAKPGDIFVTTNEEIEKRLIDQSIRFIRINQPVDGWIAKEKTESKPCAWENQ